MGGKISVEKEENLREIFKSSSSHTTPVDGWKIREMKIVNAEEKKTVRNIEEGLDGPLDEEEVEKLTFEHWDCFLILTLLGLGATIIAAIFGGYEWYYLKKIVPSHPPSHDDRAFFVYSACGLCIASVVALVSLGKAAFELHSALSSRKKIRPCTQDIP